MSNQESRIVTKIIHELVLFYQMHGYQNIELKTKKSEQEFVIMIYSAILSEDLLKQIHEKIDRERDLEIETYGWQLVGDIDAKSELEIVGHLIDEMMVEKQKQGMKLTFIRKNRYKQKKTPKS